jgi:hypothetical protein
MIFHVPDRSCKRLASCWKRAKKLALKGELKDKHHPLVIQWSNCCMILDASDKEAVDYVYDIVLMDWFALKVDEFCKSNMIADDMTARAVLAEWQARMIFDPTKLLAANTRVTEVTQ